MNKVVLTVLTALLCLSTASSFAQTKQETLKEKVVRLEVENQVLSEQVTSLKTAVSSLQSQLAQLKQNQAKQAVNKPSVKPYYESTSIQAKCEKYAKVATWASLWYNRDSSFKVVSSCETSGYFGQTNITRQQLYLQTTKGIYVYFREGEGYEPNSWSSDGLVRGSHMPPCNWSH